MADLIYKDESYLIVGAAIKVYNALGFGYQEKYYYRGLKNEFARLGFKVTEQLFTPLILDGNSIGDIIWISLLKKVNQRSLLN